MSLAQALVAGTSGCAGGTHSDTFMLTVLSCANAGVTLAASSNAKNAFLIAILSLIGSGVDRPFCGYCYRIELSLQAGADCGIQPAITGGARFADKSPNHWRGAGGIAARAIAARL